MAAIGMLLNVVGGLFGLAAFVCFILIVVKMFQNDKSTLGILSIVLFFCAGIGYFMAFIVGWINAAAWNARNIMLAWTVCFVISVLLSGLSFVALMGQAMSEMQDMPPMEGDFQMDAPFEPAPAEQ